MLAVRDVMFVSAGVTIVGPSHITVEQGQHVIDVRDDSFAASLVAQIAAGIVKPSQGTVFISDYDPAIQPVQAKRLVGFVPSALPKKQLARFESYVRYRAALWSIEFEVALRRARAAMSILAHLERSFARALAGALVSAPSLVVIDQPPENSATEILAAIGTAGLLTTHTCKQDRSG
ncbi:MAG: hypothetical protein M3160_03805 [Candidatus Eremiobacteraeota bacterium]|nr:hypothetical protein [Candidatus Eremiobacteraeota bacterium]